MPNTFLNTGRTVVATSNPQANIEQVQPNTQPVVQNNTTNNQVNANTQPSTQNSQNNAINPITIPIQIQPTVATQNTQPQTQSVQPQQNLQVQQRSNVAPTPQTYQAPQYNNNVIDFNQIYSSYQSAYGNNNSTTNIGASGIKKTSIGTTIVTPTTANMNSVEGMYQSAYSNTINSLISEMITQLENRLPV